jgi:16S rRNA (adenine1518-N6/adenine1519-N6)-dimethyltransferase
MPRIAINQPSDLVRHYRHRAKKRLGQHFLVDPSILDRLIEEAGVEEGDRVLEIGPGCGTLTWSLVEHGAEVTAVEVDDEAVEFLREVPDFEDHVEIVEGDILDLEVDGVVPPGSGPWRCVSNLPYNAATEILFHLAPALDRFEKLVLMFQREVAHRLIAEAGDDEFGRLSLMARLYADIEIVQTLAPGAFTPAPKVHSAAARFTPVPETRIPDDQVRETFRRLVRSAFSRRRKILPNALGGMDTDKDRLEEIIEAVGLERTVRPERVPFERWVELAERLVEE